MSCARAGGVCAGVLCARAGGVLSRCVEQVCCVHVQVVFEQVC